MATALPVLKFKGVAAPKIRLATTDEKEIHQDVMKDQTSDLLAFHAEPFDTKIKEVVPMVKPSIKMKPMFGKSKGTTLKAQPKDEVTNSKADPQLPFTKIQKYDDELQEHAIDILSTEYSNPYQDKSLAPFYPLQTRMGFQDQILKVFNKFMKTGDELLKEPDYDACKKMGLAGQQQVEMYEYQKFVRDYIRQAAPYRGILVYHGLGSGKTCTAIAAAEALLSVSRKKIIVMTPSSLRDNFVREISFCGFRHFRLQNFWVELDGAEPIHKLFAREVLGLTSDYLSKSPAIWVPDFSQEAPNYNKLTQSQREQIRQQVYLQIKSRVKFVNYNGISASRLKQIACAEPDKDGYGFFDNSVIVIDEIHNLTRLMQGTIDPYIKHLPGHKRKIAFEPIAPGHWNPSLCKKHDDPHMKALTNYHRGYLFYRLLATARNSKIIGLSGTPLINFPEELGILMNLLAGYIHTVSFTIKQGTPQNKVAIESILKDHPFIDFEEVSIQGSSLAIMFTILPEGMKKVRDTDGVLGVQQIPPTEKPGFINEVTSEIIKIITDMKLTIGKEPEYKSEPLLPPIGEDFRKDFLQDNGSDLKNETVLRKRLQGLISYYRGSKKELMPKVTRDEIIRVPLSPYAQKMYMDVRNEELGMQMKKKKKEGQLAGIGSKAADLWAQIYNLSSGPSSNSYRMSSRQACNFAFPETIVRPRPRNKEETNKDVAKPEDDILDTINEVDEETIPLTADEEDEDDIIKAKEEDEAIEEFAYQQALKDAKEKGDDDLVASLEDEESPEVIPELAPQPDPSKLLGAVGEGKKNLKQLDEFALKREKEIAECQVGRLPGEPYVNAVRRAKQCIKTFMTHKLRLYPTGEHTLNEYKKGTSPDPNLLMKYSPKFATILQNILGAPGSSLVYSQFLDMEGIGIFEICLSKNEFDPIVIEGDWKSGLHFSARTIESFQKRPKRFRYLSFTGGEHPTLRALSLRIFNAKYSIDDKGNGSFNELPPEMSKILVDAGFTGNTLGEICRVFSITSAGAEGLSLRNVRRVHIMEPYWNHVRTDQVKGRAVRICSHVDLDWSANDAENQRTVEVFTYCSVFDPQVFVSKGVFPPIDQTILNQDGISEKDAKAEGFPIPAGAKEYVITSDEYLLALSQKKKRVLENIQNVMKTSSVDCELNYFDNKDDGLACVRLGGKPEQYAFHPILQKDIEQTAIKFKDVAKEKPDDVRLEDAGDMMAKPPMAPQAKVVKARKLTFGGKSYLAVPVQEKASGVVLSYDLYDINDIYRKKRLGTTQADAKGNPTADIMLV
jgi:hypothetical protein